MKVEVARRGGLAGVVVRGVVETSDLAELPAEDIEALLRDLPFDREAPIPSHPDSFQYEVTIGDQATRRSAVLDESEVPDKLRPLLKAAIARGQVA